MNNEELKKKIVEIIRYWYVNEKYYGYIFDLHIEEKINAIADALIAAGLTFEPIVIRTVEPPDECKKKIHEILKEEEAIIEEITHRALVAGRALDLCETAYILSLNHRVTEGISGQAIASDLGVHKFFMEQAERELAEEGKDGNKTD